MSHPVKITHEIIDLAGKLDWQVQRQHLDDVDETIKQLRSKITQVKKFLNEHTPVDHSQIMEN